MTARGIRCKRAYEAAHGDDGTRILVDRLWPRGLTRASALVDEWRKEVAPSDGLRRWFGHDLGRWNEFVSRYAIELDGKPEAWRPILERARSGRVTLVFAARDADHNNAVALRRYLDARTASGEQDAMTAGAHRRSGAVGRSRRGAR